MMPEYTFNCEKCEDIFAIVCSISEYTNVADKLKCPSCKSKKVYRNYQEDAVVTNYIRGLHECKTLGEYADKQSAKMTKSEKEGRIAGYKTKKKEGTGMKELPTGMTRAKDKGLNRNRRSK